MQLRRKFFAERETHDESSDVYTEIHKAKMRNAVTKLWVKLTSKQRWKMKNILRITTISLILTLMISTSVFAADAHYRFMHNDHDTLVIGEVVEVNQQQFIIQVADTIVSAKDLNANAPREQIRPEIAEVLHSDRTRGAFSEGDLVIASLNRDGDGFSVLWGIYTVSSLDAGTLTVETGISEISAMLTDFVNSGGRFTNFSIDGNLGRVIRHYGDADIVIYDVNPPEIQPREPLNATVDEDMMPIENGYEDMMPIMADLDNDDLVGITPIMGVIDMVDDMDEYAEMMPIRETLPAENNNNLWLIIFAVIFVALAATILGARRKSG
jgi:hypothetical protein